MNIKWALISAVIWYALVFLVGSAIMFIPPFSAMGDAFGAAIVVTVAVFAFSIPKYLYFNKFPAKEPLKDGLMLGAVFVVVSVLLDIPILVYGFAAEQGWALFTTWHSILGLVLLLLIPIAAAYQK